MIESRPILVYGHLWAELGMSLIRLERWGMCAVYYVSYMAGITQVDVVVYMLDIYIYISR